MAIEDAAARVGGANGMMAFVGLGAAQPARTNSTAELAIVVRYRRSTFILANRFVRNLSFPVQDNTTNGGRFQVTAGICPYATEPGLAKEPKINGYPARIPNVAGVGRRRPTTLWPHGLQPVVLVPATASLRGRVAERLTVAPCAIFPFRRSISLRPVSSRLKVRWRSPGRTAMRTVLMGSAGRYAPERT